MREYLYKGIKTIFIIKIIWKHYLEYPHIFKDKQKRYHIKANKYSLQNLMCVLY
jgi:hypothetical protein